MWLKSINYNFTGVWASGVIIVYCDSAVSYLESLKLPDECGPIILGPYETALSQ